MSVSAAAISTEEVTTSIPTAETADPVLVGRSAFVVAGVQFTWITGVERDAVRTAAQPDRLYAPEEVVVG